MLAARGPVNIYLGGGGGGGTFPIISPRQLAAWTSDPYVSTAPPPVYKIKSYVETREYFIVIKCVFKYFVNVFVLLSTDLHKLCESWKEVSKI